jgi:hypothetical protein
MLQWFTVTFGLALSSSSTVSPIRLYPSCARRFSVWRNADSPTSNVSYTTTLATDQTLNRSACRICSSERDRGALSYSTRVPRANTTRATSPERCPSRWTSSSSAFGPCRRTRSTSPTAADPIALTPTRRWTCSKGIAGARAACSKGSRNGVPPDSRLREGAMRRVEAPYASARRRSTSRIDSGSRGTREMR